LPKTNNQVIATKPTARSRITNGSALLNNVDGRSVWARRMRDLIELHTSDLGGVDACSHAERSILRRVACLSVELEHLETKFASEGPATPQDLDLYQRTSNSLRRLLESVGIKRRMRNITPSVDEYLNAKAEEVPS